MRIIKETRLAEFWGRHPDARRRLMNWRQIVRGAGWENIAHVRATFSHADPVTVASGKTVTVFNVCGNKYRLITAIHYNTAIVYVLRFLTHAEYSKHKWKVSL